MVIDVIDLNLKTITLMQAYDSDRNLKANQIYRSHQVAIMKVDCVKDDDYKIEAKVDSSMFSNEKYNVNLEIKNSTVISCNCECMDNQKGNICKHILATCKELISPHEATTFEGMLKLTMQRNAEEKERRRKFKEQREAERKRMLYEQKYSNALSLLREYKEYDDMPDFNFGEEDSNNIDLRSLYNETIQNALLENRTMGTLSNNVQLEPKVELMDSKTIKVSFKIGETTKYILKDIGELYNAFQNNDTLQYGKKLSFVADKSNFDKRDLELLEFLLKYGDMVKYAERMNESSYRYYYSGLPTRKLTLFEDKIDEFFNIVKNRPILFDENDNDRLYEVTDEPLNIQINFKENKKEKEYILKLNIQNFNTLLGKSKIYIFYNQKIFALDKKENKELIKLLEIMEFANELKIPEDKFTDFSRFIFPKIEKYFSPENQQVEIVKNAVLVNKLASKMYLDVDDNGNITMQLKFCYNEYEFNVLDKDYLQYVKENKIERNIIEEKKVLTRIFEDGFELVNGKRYFVLKDLDEIYEFLSNKIESYMNDYEILVTDKFKSKEIKKPKLSSVSVKLDNGLLELDISKLDFNVNEIKNVLNNYRVKKKYYKLKNGDFLSLEKNEDLEFLDNISSSFDIDYSKVNNGTIKLPVSRSIYLNQLLDNNKEINSNKDNEFNKLVTNIENKNLSENIKINKEFEKVLRDYQKTGCKWLKVLEHYKFGGILADDMGLGKTIQVIALLASDKKIGQTSIVVAPSSLVLNWKAEIEKWCPKLKVCIIRGNAESRKKLIDRYKEFDVVLTSYDLLKRDVEQYEGNKFKYIIADEAQYIKNFNTQNATALKSLNGETKFALTGTPIENSVSELWSIFDFIMPGYLYSYNKFKKKFEEPILKMEDKNALQRLKTLISPFILRRVKKDVLIELPEKNITVMKNEMTDEQEKIYMAYFAQTKKEVNEELSANGFEKSKFKILMLLTRLRQICCHPSLFIENYNDGSGKLNQCLDIIEEAIASGHKILLFSSYTSMFGIIEEEFKKRDINYYKLTGSTPVSTRVDMVEEFNKNNDIKVFLISLKAGGTGLNLTGADVVIHYDPWWNLSAENQATDRAYRIGQRNSVQVYKLITTNSIEEKINNLQERKSEISEKLLSTEETFINKLSKEEIMNLFE